MLVQFLTYEYVLSAILSLMIVIILSWITCGRCSSQKLPPGPSSLPIIGHLHLIKTTLFLTFHNLTQKYGTIFQFRLGQRQLIVISSTEHLKSVLSQDKFNGRLNSILLDQFTKKCGVIFAEGETWKTHRRLSLQILRDFGFGKSLSEEVVRQEATELCEYLDEKIRSGNNLVESASVFCSSTMNVISSIVFAERPGYENKEFIKLLEMIHTITQKRSLFSELAIIFPWLTIFSLSKMPLLSASKVVDEGHAFIFKKLAEHRQYLDDNDIVEPRDFVDAYYLAQKQYAQKHGVESAKKDFSDWQIMRTVFELYLAGLDTTATTLCWTTLLLSFNPSVRQRMAQEIHQVIGKDKIVCMEDKKQFQYCLAVIDEIQRWTSLAPHALMHRAIEAAKIGEYDIPKDALIIPNLYSIHHDPQLWEKPDEFYPQHFLSEDGSSYRPREHLLPFGIGKRVCLGESLARIEIFIFIITLVQRYQFEAHFNNKKGESLEKALIGSDGPVRGPGNHKILITKLE